METTIQRITMDEVGGGFPAVKAAADEAAAKVLRAPMCLAWVDVEGGRESPAHASECHGDCDVPGAVEYARSRGCRLEVDVGGGRYVFCYLEDPLAE